MSRKRGVYIEAIVVVAILAVAFVISVPRFHRAQRMVQLEEHVAKLQALAEAVMACEVNDLLEELLADRAWTARIQNATGETRRALEKAAEIEKASREYRRLREPAERYRGRLSPEHDLSIVNGGWLLSSGMGDGERHGARMDILIHVPSRVPWCETSDGSHFDISNGLHSGGYIMIKMKRRFAEDPDGTIRCVTSTSECTLRLR